MFIEKELTIFEERLSERCHQIIIYSALITNLIAHIIKIGFLKNFQLLVINFKEITNAAVEASSVSHKITILMMYNLIIIATKHLYFHYQIMVALSHGATGHVILTIIIIIILIYRFTRFSIILIIILSILNLIKW